MGETFLRFIVTYLAVLVSLFFSCVPIPEGDCCLIKPGGKGRGAGIMNLVGIVTSVVW